MHDDIPPWAEEDLPAIEGEYLPVAQEHHQEQHVAVVRLTNCKGCRIPLTDDDHPQVCEQCLHWHKLFMQVANNRRLFNE